ncbi:hypothetical protein FOBRF1_006529 [Fusarium oxysporum]
MATETTVFRVSGLVRRRDGSPLVDQTVEARDIDLRRYATLGRSVTGSTGRYGITFKPSQLSHPGKKFANLQILVLDSHSKILANSNILFNAPEIATLDVTVGAPEVLGPPEYYSVMSDIAPILKAHNPPLTPADLRVTPEQDDLAFIVSQTGAPRDKLEDLVTAHRLFRILSISTEVLYGVFRKELPSEPELLLARPPSAIRKAIIRAIADNIIQPRTDAEVDALLASFTDAALKRSSGDQDFAVPVSPMTRVLKLSSLRNLQPLVRTFAQHSGTPQQFWDKLGGLPEIKPHIQSIQTSLQFGVVAMNHAPLIQELQRRLAAGRITSFSDLARFKKKDWLGIVNQENIGVPDEVPGDAAKEKKQVFAAIMENMIEDAVPHRFFVERLQDADDDDEFQALPGKPDLRTFFRNNPDFDLTKTRFADFVSKKPTALDGISNKPELTELATGIQRLHLIAPRYSQVRRLVADGVSSSQAITRMGRSTFMLRYSSSMGGESEALTIFNRASYAHSVAFNLLANFSASNSSANLPVMVPIERLLADSKVDKGIPDWSTLFGSPDTCACDRCHAMDSPAAYFVDILHFLKDRLVVQSVTRQEGIITSVRYQTRVDPRTGTTVDKNFKDALFERRPDLGMIELSCENTKLPLPYVDLTLEILENALSPPPPFSRITLPNTTEILSALNSGKVDVIRTRFTPPLSQTASITTLKKDRRWVVDDSAHSYRIERDVSVTPPTVQVVTRSLQTSGSAAERAAVPQYLNIAAYNALAQQLWPWELPFNLYFQTVRAYLARIEVSRPQLMQALSSTELSVTIDRLDIAREALGLAANDYGLIARQASPPNPAVEAWRLYGFPAATLSATNSIPDPANKLGNITSGQWAAVLTGRVDIFLQRTGMEYLDLLNLLEVQTLFSGTNTAVISAHPNALPDTCKLNELRIENWTSDTVLEKIHSFIRLWKKLSGWSVIDLGRALRAFRDTASEIVPFTDTLIVQLSHVKRVQDMLSIDLETVLTFWRDMETALLSDHRAEETERQQSFYERTFCNPGSLRERSPIFTNDPATLTGTITAQIAPVSASLGISPRDTSLLITETSIISADQLNLANLSKLLRHSSLARALELPSADYITLLRTTGISPFSSPTATVTSILRIRKVLSSGFTLSELNYLLRHEYTDGDEVNPTDSAVSTFLDGLRTGFRTIVSQNTFQPGQRDDKGQLVKAKLLQLNWATETVNKVIDMLNNTAPFETSLSSFPVLPANVPEEVVGKLTFDPESQTLSTVGVMSPRERDLLLATTGMDDPSRAAVRALFDVPRTFFQRYCRLFVPQKYTVPLEALPSDVTIPMSLSSKVIFEPANRTLTSKGPLTETELSLLLAGVPSGSSYHTAITALFDLPLSPLPADEETRKNSFLTSTDVFQLFDNDATTNAALSPQGRFVLILQKLLPAIRQVLCRQAVVRALSTDAGMQTQDMEYILGHLSIVDSFSLIETMCDTAFIQGNPAISATPTLFPSQFVALVLVKKVALLLKKFKFSFIQLKWLFEFRKDTIDPAAAWLDLNSLPLAKTTPPPSPAVSAERFAAWERLSRLASLRDRLGANGATLLDNVFTLARTSGVNVDLVLGTLAESLGVPETELSHVSKTILGLSDLRWYQHEAGLDRLLDALAVLKQLGCSAADAIALASAVPDVATAQLAVQVVKSKYDQDTWLSSIARPLCNTLREQQRSSLVTALLSSRRAAQLGWRSPADISAHYLIDVEMGPCQLTSRIKQGICSVQTFVQRCLLNLEAPNGLVPNDEVDDRWLEWDWMKYQNVHGANYRILISPENFLEADVRQDQTPLFKELAAELQQTDVTQATVEKAYRKYLTGLNEVSRLDIVGFYHEEERYGSGPPAVDIMHIIGRTRGQSRKYFYIQRIDSHYWSPGWIHVEADIQSDHILPVVWNRRLFLFWAEFVHRQDQKPISMPGAGQTLPSSPNFWEVKIAWSQLDNGRWLGKQVSEAGIMTPVLQYDEQPVRADQLTLRSRVGVSKATADKNSKVDVLEIQCVAQKERLTTTGIGSGVLGSFVFRGVNSAPDVVNYARDNEINVWPLLPPNTKLRNMSFEEDVAGEDDSSGLDLNVLTYNTSYSWNHRALSFTKEKVSVLGNTPGTFHILSAHQDPQFLCQRPFFFQHDQCAHFVVPTIVPPPIAHVSLPEMIEPSWLDGRPWAKYADKFVPLFPELDRPYPPPEMAGGLKYPVSAATPRFAVDSLITGQQPLRQRLGIAQIGQQQGLATTGAASSLAALRTTPIVWKPGEGLPNTVAENTKIRPAPVRTTAADIGSPLLQYAREIPGLGAVKPAVGSKIIEANRIPIFTQIYTPAFFKFSLAYHPFIKEFLLHLNRDGIDGLMQRPLQLSHSPSFQHYQPTFAVQGSADEVVDFDDGLYSVYNWELFYHIPLLIAERLSKNQKFQEAQKWFHYIFDPTDTSSLDSPQKFWSMRKFFETTKTQYALETLPALFRFMAARSDPDKLAQLTPDEKAALERFEGSVDRWRKDPFQPFAVAQTRTTAFQKSVVMKYLDNLIAWGDSLFRADTIEKINEATRIYTLAAEILGPRPKEIPSRASSGPHTFGSLEPLLTSLSNALVSIEDLVRPSSNAVAPADPGRQAVRPSMLYFCAPRNDKMLSYWDTVADRLFKIRNCQNLQGITRQLALFDPPIDPLLLARAAASGLDISSALSDIGASLPHHRFGVMIAKAFELVAEVRNLGNTTLSLLEKRDGEALALLRQRHETTMLDAVRAARVSQLAEANASVEAAKRGRATVQARYDHYNSIEFMNIGEKAAMGIESAIGLGLLIEASALIHSGAAFIFPEIKVGTPTTLGATVGGNNFGKAAGSFAAFMHNNAALAKQASSMVSTQAGYQRRQQDWDLQKALADLELKQMDQAILGLQIRVKIATTELKNHDMQRKNATEIDEFMRSKLASADLYNWISGQLSALYFQSYTAAYDLAKKAETAYRYELGLPDATTPFIRFGYWDSLRKGLVAGDKLFHDLKQMEMSFLELDAREYELTTTFSLAQLDPIALVHLRESGEAFFNIPEAVLDLLYPGQYFRRLKSVSLTLPCIVGPFTPVVCTLTLLKSSTRTTSRLLSGGTTKYARVAVNDTRFSDVYGSSQSIATSTGQNDAGVFDVSLRDERYLPFERRGAISSWRIQLPFSSPPGAGAGSAIFRPFDYRTLSDVLITLRYTAREGGDAMRAAVQEEMTTKLLKSISMAESQNGLARLVSLRHDFPTAWSSFLGGTRLPVSLGSSVTKSQMAIDLGPVRFPFVFSQTPITIENIQVFVVVRDEFNTEYTPERVELWLGVAPPQIPADRIAISTAVEDKLRLGRWGKSTLRGSKEFRRPAGQWVLVGSLAGAEGDGQLRAEAIQGVYLIVGFSVRLPQV